MSYQTKNSPKVKQHVSLPPDLEAIKTWLSEHVKPSAPAVLKIIKKEK